MKIVVMGAGAVGGYFGGVLSRGGHDVTFVARGAHLEAINRDGLRIESETLGDLSVNAPAVERLDAGAEAELVLLCVKSYHNERALDAIAPAVGEATSILTLQNGIGGGDQIAAKFGSDKVLLGAAYIEAMRKGPGVVSQAGGPPRIVFGEESTGPEERSKRVLLALQEAGVDARMSENIHADLWTKLIFICALSGMTCISRASFADVMDTPETLELSWQVVREAAAVARAIGIALAGDVVESTMAEFQEEKHNLISSMYADLMAGNPLEIAVINGAVSRFGAEAGVETPVNDFITACLTVADKRARSLL